MAKSKSIITRIQHWMDSVSGQTFMNYAYSWGAAVVILGALFKLIHVAGANYWLIAGMGTEVFVFIISGFDRSSINFEKAKMLEAKRRAKELAEEGVELPIDSDTAEALEAEGAQLSPEAVAALAAAAANGIPQGGGGGGAVIVGGGVPAGGGGGGTIIVGGGVPAGGVVGMPLSEDSMPLSQDSMPLAEDGMPLQAGGVVGGGAPIVLGGGGVIGGATAGGVVGGGTVAPVSLDATEEYANTLHELTDTLNKVNEQARRLTSDSEEMQNLSRTLTGINVIYEQQLKQVSAQMGSMDEINIQVQQMAKYIAELNSLYARMIEAMTVNLSNK